MSRRARQLLLLAVLMVSVCLIAIFLVYGSGYSINWKERTLESHSGLVIITRPRRATVTIKPLSLGFNTPLELSALAPGAYRLAIERDGYATARYHVSIAPRQTLQFQPVILWPEHPTLKRVTRYPAWAISPATHQTNATGRDTTFIWNASHDKVILQQTHALLVYDSATRQLRTIVRQAAPIQEALWYDDDWYIFYVSNNALHVIDNRTDYGQNDVRLVEAPQVRDVRMSRSGHALWFTGSDGIYKLGIR